jgi:hypothetical protein
MKEMVTSVAAIIYVAPTNIYSQYEYVLGIFGNATRPQNASHLISYRNAMCNFELVKGAIY